MDSLEKILENWDQDSEIDQNEPGKALLEIPKLHSKYLRCLIKHNLLLKTTKDKFNIERKYRYNYYSGHYNSNKDILIEMNLEPFKLVLKSDISIYLESDDVLIKLSNKETYLKEIIKACEMILGELKSRTFQLRDYIAYLKFKEGS